MVDMSLQKGAVLTPFIWGFLITFLLSLTFFLLSCFVILLYLMFVASLLIYPIPPPKLSLHYSVTRAPCSPHAPSIIFFTHFSAILSYYIQKKKKKRNAAKSNHHYYNDSLPRQHHHLHKKRTGSLGAAFIYLLKGASGHYYAKTRFAKCRV